MTDKQMEEKKKEFMTKWRWESFFTPEVPEGIWDWIEKLVEEVENRCWKECEASKENEAIQAGAGY